MKISKSVFVAALQLVSAASASKASMPELGNVRLKCDATSGSMTMTCTDLDRTITETVQAQECETMDVCANVAQLSSVASEVDGDTLDLSLVNNRTSIKLTGNRPNAWFRLPISSPSSAIAPVSMDGVKCKEVDIAKVAQSIAYCRAAATSELSRGVLQYVYVNGTGKICDIVATDGRRLHLRSIEGCGIDKDSVLLSKNMQRIIHLLENRQGLANVAFIKLEGEDEVSSIMIEHGATRLKLRNAAGKYPNYPHLMDRIKACKDVEIVGDISATLNRMSIVDDNINISIDGNTMKLVTVGKDLMLPTEIGEFATEQVEIKNGLGLKFCASFKSEYLIDAFAAAGENASFLVQDGDKNPCALRSKNSGFLAIIMPLLSAVESPKAAKK